MGIGGLEATALSQLSKPSTVPSSMKRWTFKRSRKAGGEVALSAGGDEDLGFAILNNVRDFLLLKPIADGRVVKPSGCAAQHRVKKAG